MTRVLLSRAAEADLDEIDAYTRETFGLGQAITLRKQFREALDLLAVSPLAAPNRPEYDPPGKSFRYRSVLRRFIIVYEPLSGGVRVARILHGARDLADTLVRDAGDD